MTEKKRILIVDDEQDLCEILQFNLESAGYQADVAYSAEEALRKIVNWTRALLAYMSEASLKKSSNSKCFDLLLLDVMMPGLSGFQLAQRLKADEQTAHIPIIFITAKDTEDDTLLGFGLGADDYVTKPFSVREVVARVNAVLKRNQPQTKLLQYEGLVVDQSSKTVTIDNDAVELTRTEFDLLALACIFYRGDAAVGVVALSLCPTDGRAHRS